MSQVNDIKKLEQLVRLKKEEHTSRMQEAARDRYDQQVKNHDVNRNKFEDEIQRLEMREKELINRLKHTQTHHQMYVEDLDRIMNNE